MTKYEILYIVPSSFADPEIEGVVKQIEGVMEKQGAKIFKTQNLGKIKLAFPIKQNRYGTYILAFFEAEPAVIAALDKTLRMTDEVLRHQILILAKGAESKTFTIESYVPPLTDEGQPLRKPRRVVKPLAPPPPMKVEESRLTIEELDKKLDEILESDDMSDKV